MIKEFMGTFWPIFTPPHVLNLMDDANNVYKLQGPNMVNYTIHIPCVINEKYHQVGFDVLNLK